MNDSIKNRKVSIITPTLDSEKYIERAIISVMKQDYRLWEHIIIDGGSKDNTIKILKKYSHIIWVTEKDDGIYDAMNKGVSMASGDLIYFLGSDDEFYNENVLSNVLRQSSGEDFIYGNVEFRHSKRKYSGESNIIKLIRDQISICHQSVFYSKSLFTDIGLFNTKYFIHADYDFNVKCFEDKSVTKKYIDIIIAVFNEKGISGLSSNADRYHDDLKIHYLKNYANSSEIILQCNSLLEENNKLKSELRHLKKTFWYKLYIKIKKALN